MNIRLPGLLAAVAVTAAIGITAAVALDGPSRQVAPEPAGLSLPPNADPSAAAGAAASEPPTLTAEQALARDAATYAEGVGIPVEEAVKRLEGMLATGEVTAELRSALPERFAGIWREHSPEFRTIVWFTGGLDGLDAVRAIAAKSSVPVVIRAGAKHSLAELLAIQDQLLAEGNKEWSPAGVDESTGTIRVNILPDATSTTPAGLTATLEARFGVPFTASVSGRNELLTTYGGRYWGSLCTTGFSVRNAAG